MTRRATVICAGIAVLVTVVALVAGPFLSRSTPAPALPTATATASATAGLVTLAVNAAGHAVGCLSPSPPPDRWCGTLTVTRHQTTCATATRCTVELIGALHTTGAPTAVALTVTLRRVGRGWQPVEVTS